MIFHSLKLPQYFLFVFFIGFICCTPSKSKTDKEDVIVNTVVYEELPLEDVLLSTYFSDYEFISLGDPGNKDQLIGEFSKVYSTGDRYIVFDKEVLGGIVVYNNKGVQVFCLLQGLAPDELIRPVDFCVQENILLVLDNGARSIKKFNLFDGQFIGAIPLKESFNYMSSAADTNTILLMRDMYDVSGKESNPFFLLDINDENKSIKELDFNIVNHSIASSYGSGTTALLESNHDVYFMSPFGYSLQKISLSGRVEQELEFDFGEKSIKRYNNEIKNGFDLDRYRQNSIYLAGVNNAIGKNDLFVSLAVEDKIHYIIIDKSLSSYILVDKFKNDLYDLSILPFVGNTQEGDLISYLSVESLILMLEHGVDLPDKLLALIGEDYDLLRANPILVRLKTKSI